MFFVGEPSDQFEGERRLIKTGTQYEYNESNSLTYIFNIVSLISMAKNLNSKVIAVLISSESECKTK